MSEGWAQNLANELHQPIRRQFPKRRVISYGIDNIWAADLVEMGKFSKWNKGTKYLLMVIDVFSKFGWIRPLKDKRGQTVADAFRSIFAERSGAEPSKARRKPKMLWTDKGSEFFNGIMKDLLHKNGVKLYTTENEEKSSVVERWNRTMKEKLFRMFSANNNTIYFDKLDELVDQYNHRFHSSIRMTPAEASKQQNEKKVFANLFGDLIYAKRGRAKFKVGDKVRISKFKRKIFDKGFTPNWTEEIFVVDEILNTNPLTYKLVDLLGEKITGSFYESELQKTNQNIFRIEKVIRRDQKKKKALVKWKGYPDKFNSWVPLSDAEKIFR